MFRRTVRIACFVIGVLVTAALGYRAFQDETSLANERNNAAAADHAVAGTAELLLDLRASLHAYVVPGQGLPFWGKRAQEGIQALRERLASLDDMVAPAGGSLKQSLERVSELEAAERRARTYVSRDDMQLAGDVVFVEIRDVLGAITGEVHSLRSGLGRDHDRRAAEIRREQLMLAGGALAVWVAIALLLLPTEAKPAVEDPAQWRNDLRETLKKSASAREDSGELRRDLAAAASGREGGPAVKPEEPVVAIAALQAVSEICADLAALSDPGALQGALERVNAVLNATGLIVWVASSDGRSLSPVAAHGFDPKLVNRIGRIARDSANLTAAAFRDNTPKVSAAAGTAPGALAVPMCGPSGPAGVLSVELKAGEPVEDAKVVLAAIVAAQLATLTMPIPNEEAAVKHPERVAM